MRKAMVFPVRFVTHDQSVQSTSRDLDETSVFVRCVEPPLDGERVVVRLYLPGLAAGETVQAVVRERVVEGEGAGFRAEFLELTPANVEHLRLALDAGPAAPPVEPAAPARAGENRRLSPRYLARFRISIGASPAAGSDAALRAAGAQGETHDSLNVSASGLFLQTATPPQEDEIVHLVLELPDGQPPAQVQGLVLHRVLPGEGEIPGAGVQFIGADDAFRDRLDALLRSLAAR